MTDYSTRERRLEWKRRGGPEPVAMVHLRCTNCGYGRMRRQRGPSDESGWLHRCELCAYQERVDGLYPRPVWPWEADAFP